MLIDEVPVEVIERTRIGAGLFVGIESAACAIVAHLADVSARRRVRLGRHVPAIRMQGHADDVGGHDPVESIDIHLQIPAQRGLRLNARDEEEITQHHETLDRLGAVEQQRELVAAVARQHARAVERGAHTVDGGAQQLVAGAVAEHVVDRA